MKDSGDVGASRCMIESVEGNEARPDEPNIAQAKRNGKSLMSNPWFRMYSEFATDPKVQMLSEVDQRRFIMLLCLRCSNGDVTLHDDAVTFQLRVTAEEWQATKARFIAKNLMDEHNSIVNWDKRQYVSDSSKIRVSRYREKVKRACNVTETPPDTDTDTDTEKKVSTRRSPKVETPGFDEFWEVYPKRDGSADRKGAVKAFSTAVKRASFTTILEGAEHFTAAMKDRGKIGTEFIPQARTWLNGDRWNDRYDAAQPSANSKEAEWLATLQKYAAPPRS